MAGPGDIVAARSTLGVGPDASEDDIKRAWRRMARETHPDLHPDDPAATARFRTAQAAYELLSNPMGVAAGRGMAGPDADWFDACAWMAESRMRDLRADILPRYAAAFRSGPTLAQALARDGRGGLAEAAPRVLVPRWVRLWVWHTFRGLDLQVLDGPSPVHSPIGVERRNGLIHLYFWPMALWQEGMRDEELVRAVVQRSIDLGVAAGAPLLLGLYAAPTGPLPPGTDRRWWTQRLLWPTLWTVIVTFSVGMLGYAWWANGPGRTH